MSRREKPNLALFGLISSLLAARLLFSSLQETLRVPFSSLAVCFPVFPTVLHKRTDWYGLGFISTLPGPLSSQLGMHNTGYLQG